MLLVTLLRPPPTAPAPEPPSPRPTHSVAVSPPAPVTPTREATSVERTAFLAQLAKRQTSPEPLPTPSVQANPIARERVVTLEQNLLQFLALTPEERAARPFRLPTPDGTEQVVEFQRVDTMSPNEGGISGTIAGVPGSHVILGYADDAVAGSWFVPGQGLFQIRATGTGQHRVRELDPSRFLPEAAPLALLAETHPQALATEPTPSLPAATESVPTLDPLPTGAQVLDPLPEAPPETLPLPVLDGLPPASASDVATVIDVMVLYTPACATANGGASGISALINASFTSANTAYANSGASQTVRRVYAAEIAYTASGALATDLPRLMNTSDGHMDTAHSLRNTYKADLVCLFVSVGTDSAGIAYMLSPSNPSGASYGFSVVMDVYADANLTFAHELGHNMGCTHAPADGGTGAFSYSYGHKFSASGTAYRTVMAYAPGIRIPYFSNPSVSYLGTATGLSTANNARTLGDTRASVSAFRAGLTMWQEWTVAATGDLNADSKPDILWRNNSSGRVIVWYMDGTTSTGTAVVWAASAVGDALWVPIATGDFNADSKIDIIWRNSATGRVIVWIMDGATRTSTATLWNPATTADALWVPYATGDFNADSKIDIIWRHSSTGRVIVWYMNGTTRTSTANLWTPASAADT
ncbi:MAG: VCBS repeat-containing protein, partial [Verrucomicrobiales bacterium]|nr:VCBS repeat-containing protein [Verrucomicrobiales bacterium]